MTFLTAPSISRMPIFNHPLLEKHYIVCGADFGLENMRKHTIKVRALRGSKSAGADNWQHVRSAMEEMGLSS